MSDVWTEAAKEAFATATGGVILFTLELYHPEWAAPIFVVSGFEDIAVTPGQVFNYYVGRGGAESIGTNHSPTSCAAMLPINGRAGADGSIRFYT